MNADAKYQRENDAKFRAVAQRVQTYEEFEGIVKASHLVPMTEDVTNLGMEIMEELVEVIAVFF